MGRLRARAKPLRRRSSVGGTRRSGVTKAPHSAGDPQPELVLQYSKLPQETLAQATVCAQAPIANACSLAGAGASAKK